MSEDLGAGPARPGRRRTLRTQVATAFAFTAVLALVSFGVVGWAFQRQVDARSRVINRIDPAGIAARDTFAALVDQETGVRGYVLSQARGFLTPYTTGRRDQAAAVRELRALVSGDPRLEARVADLERSAATWQQSSAEPVIAKIRSRDGTPVDRTVLTRSKRQFDAVRSRYNRLVDDLNAARRAARHEIDTNTSRVIVVSIVVAALLVACAIVIWVGLRRLVLTPLDRLGSDARVVTAGELSHPIEPVGPRELAELGLDIEAMRQRIVADLEATDEATTQLERQALELNRSNAELEQFAYVASHDLQEPLRKITSFCQLIERRYADQLDDRGRQYIEFAVDGAKRMQQLILDLLAFSRVGRTTAAFTTVDLRDAAAEALRNLEAGDSNAVVDIGALPTVMGDRTLLVALFQNLISNSIKFNTADIPRVTITAAPAGDFWELAVADNGIGIEPQHADRVFMIFQRLHGRDEFEGSGIGLALGQKIVTYHEGTIWIDPDVAAGTTIRWTLPTLPPGAPES